MSPVGQLCAFGSNSSGQLGLQHHEDVSVPTRCLIPDVSESDVPIKVVAGGNHTLVLFRSGNIYAAGENQDGRCGSSSPTKASCGFRKVELTASDGTQIDRFTSCSATWEASIFVHDKKHVFSCGTGHKAELGQGGGVTISHTPRRIHDFPPAGTEVVDIASSMSHTVAVLSNGEVYGWGHGRKGQLGDPVGFVWAPRRIQGLHFKAVRVCCGREFTCIVGDPEEGRHIVLGSDKWLVRTAAPERLRGWKDVGASWGGVFVLLNDGAVLSWGRNDHGQLAPAGLPPVRCIAAGSEHVVAITSDARLVAWGWGEHGNCGIDADEAGDVKGRWNEIAIAESSVASSESMVSVGAGCASSWVWCNT